MSSQCLSIAQVVADIWKESAGPSHSVTGLTRALHDLDHELRLHTLEPPPDHALPFPITYYKRWRYPYALGVSPAMRSGLRTAAESGDIMHFHGMWMMPNVYPGRAVQGTDCSLVFSPRGMLDEWAMNWSKRRKAVFWSSLQRRVIERVDCFHATSDLEAEAIRSAGFSAPIAVIPIGIDIPPRVAEPPTDNDRILLFLGRLHPKKNVESLLHAWVQVQTRHGNWSLSIVGDGDGAYVASLKQLASSLRADRVVFHGSLHGKDKDAAYDRAALYILPTFSENFGISVAEALSRGTPVITTRGAPWSGLVDNDAGWWVDPDVSSIAHALNEAMSTTGADLRAMGERGREWMEEDFRWETVASQMAATYLWLQGRGDRPDCVLVN